jgi:uncharacterized membrane protein YqjE
MQDEQGEVVEPPGLWERIGYAWDAARDLVATRREMFGTELSKQLGLLGRGAVGLALAVALAGIAVLLLTALVATLFAMLFGSVWAGILATLVLYLVATAGAGLFAWKSVAKVRFDFPATRQGLEEDWSAVRDAISPPPDRDGDDERPLDVEQRFRAGSE